MRFWNLFRKKKKAHHHKTRTRRLVGARDKRLNRFTAELGNLQSQFSTMSILVRKHDEEIGEQASIIETHSIKLERLEQIIDEPTIFPSKVDSESVNRPDTSSGPKPSMSGPPGESSQQKFDIDRFSEQERRILSVFFQHPNMALSYADIARALNKSAHTVKNQVHQINMKADLFNYSVGRENRKRFKLKEGLKIEKYLKIGTGTTHWSDQGDRFGRVIDET
jgi:DNA-binding CsgD family transcriptional regulator